MSWGGLLQAIEHAGDGGGGGCVHDPCISTAVHSLHFFPRLNRFNSSDEYSMSSEATAWVKK